MLEEMGLTVGIALLVRFCGIPIGIRRLVLLSTLLPTLGFLHEGITALLEQLVELVEIGRLLIQVALKGRER